MQKEVVERVRADEVYGEFQAYITSPMEAYLADLGPLFSLVFPFSLGLVGITYYRKRKYVRQRIQM